MISLPSMFSTVVPIVAGVGNALMAIPLVRQLKTRASAGRVTVIARSEAMAEAFRRIDEVDAVFVGKTQRMILEMRRVRADLCVVPFPSNRWQYSLLAAASGAKSILLHSYPIGRLRALHSIGNRIPALRGIHDVDQNLRLLEALGAIPQFGEAPRFNITGDDRSEASRLIDEEPFIAIHAGSARSMLAQAKRWPPKHYAELANALQREFATSILLLEGPDESGVAEQIISELPQGAARPGVARLTGSLGVAAAVLERASFYVGSDSGLGHLAAAVGKQAVTIFAPADPDRVCPFGSRDLVVKPDKLCSPCFQYPWASTYPKMSCGSGGRRMCIEEVTVNQVVLAARRAHRAPSVSTLTR